MSKKINIGIMGFGHIGRYIYKQSLNSNTIQVKAISDIGNIDSLLYLLKNDPRKEQFDVDIKNSSFVCNGLETKFVNGASPGDVDWGNLGVDWVIDATGKYLGTVNTKIATPVRNMDKNNNDPISANKNPVLLRPNSPAHSAII